MEIGPDESMFFPNGQQTKSLLYNYKLRQIFLSLLGRSKGTKNIHLFNSSNIMLCTGLEECPYHIVDENWIDDPTQWPELTYHHLYHYLIKTPSMSCIYVYIFILFFYFIKMNF